MGLKKTFIHDHVFRGGSCPVRQEKHAAFYDIL